MECSFEFDNVKAEKAKAIRRFNRLRSIASVFRKLEIALALVLLSWIFNRVPFVVKISGEFFRQSSSVIASPLFVFAVSNLIIVALIAKSRENQHNAEAEIYEEIMRNSTVSGGGDRQVATAETSTEKEEEEGVVYQDKQIISEVNTCGVTTTLIAHTCDADVEEDNNPPIYQRSKSEKLEAMMNISEKIMRRSETEKSGKELSPAAADEKFLFPEDKMSDEEFNRTIEDFIARQSMFRRRESFSTDIVVQNQS